MEEKVTTKPKADKPRGFYCLLTAAVVVSGIAVFVGLSEHKTSSSLELPWWKTTIIYQVYPRSFKDSDGDGIGDIKGIRIIIDFVPNHTSDKHVWFEKSLQNDDKYKDYYIWADDIVTSGGSRKPPNNWLSVFSGSAWTWNENRSQFYYHAFLTKQPDLNFRNTDVIDDMKGVLRFWLERGVDGIRVDALQKLFEVTDLSLNEPPSNAKEYHEHQYNYLNHPYTESLPETFEVVTRWKDVMNEFENKDGISRFMVIETYEQPSQRNIYYDHGAVPYNFDLIMDVTSECGGLCIRDVLEKEYSNLPPGAWPTFVLGNHDRNRVSKKFGLEFVNVYNMLLLTLWGTPTTYYGEELGMEEIQVSFEDTQDPQGLKQGKEYYAEFSRDPCRSPMQWTSSVQSGFSTSPTPWLPVHGHYRTVNVEVQKNSKSLSPLQLYRKLAFLREHPSFQTGSLQYVVVNKNILSYVRGSDGEGRFLVAMNFGHKTSTDNYSIHPVNTEKGTVVVTTSSLNSEEKNTRSLKDISLLPGSGIIIKL
ncbi:maltase 1-like isoform X2 [Gigantopelta aegis]|uniref:maltase 1-like isoform X2 n=1 Tax=Gigantopelta aegis TaxID=1735272 RepID=UPI001B88DEB0|nr:maltase 1-like isoform X2 [Gigantopelta aegis]